METDDDGDAAEKASGDHSWEEKSVVEDENDVNEARSA
jgi:hypothetical protein